MIRSIKLLDYLPPFMREYREMQYIMSAENPEFQHIADTSEIVKNNQFIRNCDENGIAKFENILGITPGSTDTLESRIARVWAKWIDSIPYTFRTLKKRLDALCGEGNHSEILDSNNFTITIETTLENSGRTKDIDELIDSILPANLIWKTLYSGIYGIEIDTELEIYMNAFPQCVCVPHGRISGTLFGILKFPTNFHVK